MGLKQIKFARWEEILMILTDFENTKNQILYQAQIVKKQDITREHLCYIIRELKKNNLITLKERKIKKGRIKKIYLTPKGLEIGELLLKIKGKLNK